MRLNSAKDLEVYKKAYALAMEIFEISGRFAPEERYALTGQIRPPARRPLARRALLPFGMPQSPRGVQTPLRSPLRQQADGLRW
jgi:hypothetical protein